MSKIKVLVFPAEGCNAVELHDALSTCVNIELWGATSVRRHGRFIFKNLIEEVPYISSESFIDEFNKILEDKAIDVIFPTHDTVALFLVSNKGLLKSKVISGDLRTTSICRSKIQTYELFKSEAFLPRRINSLDQRVSFPLFSKPDAGEGGKGIKIIANLQELQNVDLQSNLVTEYLPGREYTVDCFTDKDGKLRYISQRSRDRLSAGVSVAGVTMKVSNQVQYIADVINGKLNFLGLWYFQLREDVHGNVKLLEVSTRCAGTMCHTRAKGINLPLLSVYAAMGYDVSVFDNSYEVEMDRTLLGRYFIHYEYSTVYIDFDDTITLRGEVNLDVIRFLYQCKNKNIKLVLLTRHEKELNKTLSLYHICPSLFDEVIHIEDGTCKSAYITSEKSIFIDNAYKEREEVKFSHHIPVFDVDQVEFLFDWKK